MKVILVINSLGGGGAEKQALMAVRALATAGIDCSIFTLRPAPMHPAWARLWGGAQAAGVRWIAPARGGLAAHWQLCRLLRAQPGALVWTWGHRAEAAVLLARLAGGSSTMVGSLRDADERRIRRWRSYWRVVAPRFAAMVSNSRANVEMLERVVPGVASKCTVIYNGLEVEPHGERVRLPVARPDRLEVVMLGNLHLHKKGYDVAVQVAQLAQRAGKPMVLRIGGAPFQLPELRRLMREAGVDGAHLSIEGEIRDPAAFLRSGHLFLMLSRFEGTPNALLEALALGLPAVCTRVADVGRLLADGEHLRLVNIGDAQGAWQAITGAWDNWSETLRMAEAGRRRCLELFSEQTMAAATVTFFKNLPSGGQQHGGPQ